MNIDSFDISRRVLLIAEIGNNHEGSLAVARRLVQEASDCGVDAVKFQTFKTEFFVSRGDAQRFARLKSFELSPAAFGDLAELAHDLGLLFISTPLDLPSAKYLCGLVDAFKIASGDNTFFPLIQYVAKTGKPFLVSLGISADDEINNLVEFIRCELGCRTLKDYVALLHCITSYPTPPEEVHLRALEHLKSRFPCAIGYSDHTLGIEAAVLSVALGARIIEKHFTLDKSYSDFRDHQLSADPPEMRQLVERVRRAEQLLGSPQKRCQPSEKPLAELVRRSIVAARDVPQGGMVTSQDLMWIRPGGGLAPGHEHLLLGRRLKRAVSFGERLLPADVE